MFTIMENQISAISSELKRIRHEERGPFLLNVPKCLLASGKRYFDRIENHFYLTRLAHYGSRLATGKIRFVPEHMKAVLLGRLYSKRVVPHLLLQVCALCQNKCLECANDGLIRLNPEYQMSLDNVDRFIQYTAAARYFIEYLWFEGPGEPTLWRHFNEAVEMISTSGIAGSIGFTTNGLSLDRIVDATWPRLGRVIVSRYPGQKNVDLTELKKKSRRYGFILEVRTMDRFRRHPTVAHPDSLPASCVCSGPMIYGDKVLFYCGTPGIAAGLLMGTSLLDHPHYATELGPDYLKGISTKAIFGLYSFRTGHFDVCRYCWANMKIKTEMIHHEVSPRTASMKRCTERPSPSVSSR